MYDSSSQVTKYHNDQVSLPGKEQTQMRNRRNANRDRLKKGLKSNGKPAPIGCHSQGSYRMWTMVQDADNDFDIDDGVYFKDGDLVGPNGGKMNALQVRQMVCEALQVENKFKRAPEVLKNCVRVYYNEGHHVDVPAYRRIESKCLWTGGVTYTYELASSDWKRSDPKQVTNWFNATNKSLSPDSGVNGGQFRRVVRMLKKFARSRSSWKTSMASGFMLTKLAQEEFLAVEGREDKALRETMRRIYERLSWNTTIDHPVPDCGTLTKEGDGRPGFLRDRLKENLKHLEVLDEPGCSHDQAMKAWDKVFNCDWFAQQPTPERTSAASVCGEPTAAIEKRGGGRYA